MFCVVGGPRRGVYGCFVGEDGPARAVSDGETMFHHFVLCLNACLLVEELCVVLECMLPARGAWRFAKMLIHVHFGKFLH